MACRTVQGGEIRCVINGDVIIDFRQQYTAETLRQSQHTAVFRTARLTEPLNIFFQLCFFQRDFITLNSHFALTLQQLLHIFGNIVGAGERFM